MTRRAPHEKYVAELLEPYPEHLHRFAVENGSRHMKLTLDGKLLLVLTRGQHEASRRTLRNAQATVRRALLRC